MTETEENKTPKCPCGREAATQAEHAAAHKAGKCAVCYEIARWANALAKGT